MSVKALRKVQIGKETTAGTAVAATMIFRGTGILEDTRQISMIAEDVGFLSPMNRSATTVLGGMITLEADATFEQLPYILAAGVTNLITGAADGSGSGKIYAYSFPTTAAQTIKTLTIEMGDDQQAERIEYCFTESFKLSGAYGETVKLSAVMQGRQVSLTTFTGSLSLLAMDTLVATKSTLYIDAISGTVGSTQKSSTLVGWDLDVKTGWAAAPVGDGNLYFGFAKNVGPTARLTVTFEHDATAEAEKVAWRAETPRLVRVKVEGPALTTNGTAYSKKTLLIDVPGKWESFSLGDRDGNDISTGVLVMGVDGAYPAKPMAITVVNETASLP